MFAISANAQQTYNDSINDYLAKYVREHEVVKGDDQKGFHFYPVNKSYRVTAKLEPVTDGKWFSVETSSGLKQSYRVYGYLHFTLRDTIYKLALYQSQMLMAVTKYKNYLFLPFTDETTGNETYEAGRYIDLESTDIKNNTVVIDFNKAYNPYCAYGKGKFNCPIPPKENTLATAIEAGEKKFEKSR